MEKKPELKTLRGLISRARRFKKEQGYFLLLFDAVGSRELTIRHRNELQDCFYAFSRAARESVVCYVPRVTGKMSENPFDPTSGDGGGAYLSDPKIIPEILELAKTLIPFRLRWNVAKDEWDEKNMKTVK